MPTKYTHFMNFFPADFALPMSVFYADNTALRHFMTTAWRRGAGEFACMVNNMTSKHIRWAFDIVIRDMTPGRTQQAWFDALYAASAQSKHHYGFARRVSLRSLASVDTFMKLAHTRWEDFSIDTTEHNVYIRYKAEIQTMRRWTAARAAWIAAACGNKNC